MHDGVAGCDWLSLLIASKISRLSVAPFLVSRMRREEASTLSLSLLGANAKCSFSSRALSGDEGEGVAVAGGVMVDNGLRVEEEKDMR